VAHPANCFGRETKTFHCKVRSNPGRNTSNNGSATGLSITTYPNPSNGQFIFSVLAANLNGNADIDIIVYNMNGVPIAGLKSVMQTGSIENLIWDANKVSAGVYYYSAKTTDGALVSGKLVKL
jgi:hypothetical protein